MAQWAGDKGPAQSCYCTNYLIDIEHNIILDVEPTPAYRTAEVDSARHMLERVEANLNYRPERLIADTSYGSAPMLNWLVKEKNIAPYIPVWDKSNGKPGLYGRSDFIWNDEADHYLCPAGKLLQRRRRIYKNRLTDVTTDNTIIYRASKADCDKCQNKPVCCPNTPNRKIARSIYESSRNVARAIKTAAQYKQSRKDRKKVEVLFAHLKRIMGFDRLRLRGISGARDEFLMAATVQNLRKLAQTRYKPPNKANLALG